MHLALRVSLIRIWSDSGVNAAWVNLPTQSLRWMLRRIVAARVYATTPSTTISSIVGPLELTGFTWP